MKVITATKIESMLNKWSAGEIDASQIHEWAENRYMTDKYDAESDRVNEVLAKLDMLNMNLVTKEDIPTLLAVLKSDDYLAVLDDYFNKVDIEKRKKELCNIELYEKFCV
tara:strand:+ start:7978 stop:8307 length:330 start_codon:yes stop_codon:yes gene_type:complete